MTDPSASEAKTSDAGYRWRDLLFGPLAGPSWTICLGVGLHAVNWLAVATVMPVTARALDRVGLIDAATSVYLAAFILGSVVGGAAKQRFGARAVMLAGAAAVAAGTVAAAAAPAMAVVLLGRVGQGAGEGLVVALSYALIREMFPHPAVPRAFGLLAVVYAIAAFVAPPLFGALTDAVSWRIALLALLIPTAVLIVVALRVVPGTASGAGAPLRVPVLRLGLVAAGIGAATTASAVEATVPALALLAACPLLLTVAARLDRAAAERLMPRDLLTPGAPVAAGLAVVLLMSLAAPAVHVFAPLIATGVHGASTAGAGMLVSLTALAWSGTAILVAGAGPGYARRALVGGPVLLAVALALVAASLGGGPLAVAAVGIAAVGCAFGASWAFLSQRVMAVADAEDLDRTAGALPTLQAVGGAAGAAAAGVVADLAGLAPALASGGGVAGPVAAIYGTGAAIAAAAALAALRLAGTEPRQRAGQAGTALRSSRGERP